MTLGDAAQITVALIALGLALYAVRRDRADLRVRFADGAAGTFILSIVNVGLRPVRVERLVRKHGWIWRQEDDHTSWQRELAGVTTLPTIVEPAHEIFVAVGNEANYSGNHRWQRSHGRWELIDAAGKHYRVQ